MQTKTGRVVVEVDLNQRFETKLGDHTIKTGARYSESFRQKNPAVCKVIEGNELLSAGTFLVCHYNHFDEDSPYKMYDNVFSIPLDELTIGRLDENGDLIAMFGNILVEEVEKPSFLELPSDLKKQKVNHGLVAQDAGDYKKGDEILWLNYSNYKVLWKWMGVEREATRIEISEIVAFLKK